MKTKRIVYASDISLVRLQKSVTQLLGMGWELYGNIVVDSNNNGTQYIQALVHPDGM